VEYIVIVEIEIQVDFHESLNSRSQLLAAGEDSKLLLRHGAREAEVDSFVLCLR